MFSISYSSDGEVLLKGRLDASRVDEASALLDAITETKRLNFQDLDYISSAGLGVLLRTQKRLSQSGHQIILTHLNKMVRDVFKTARFDLIFKVEDVPAGPTF